MTHQPDDRTPEERAGETQPGDIAVRDVAELLLESQPSDAATGPSAGGPRA